jgi:hypothetical protein
MQAMPKKYIMAIYGNENLFVTTFTFTHDCDRSQILSTLEINSALDINKSSINFKSWCYIKIVL